MAAFDTILFVNRGKIDISLSGKIFSFPFAPTVVKDLEILDNETLKSGLEAFLDKNKITFGSCGIFLSDSVCFVSEPVAKTQNLEDALASFMASLPFENPVARILGDKIVGTNKDLYQAIIDVVGQKGGRVKMISPIFLSKEMFSKKGLDEQVLKFISSNEDLLYKATFTYEAPMPPRAEPEAKPKKRSRREMILIGVFIALAIGLIVWLLTRVL